jgi:2-hydroxy-6-oxonona-2,4-dienedioate hydrolase
MQTQTQLFGPLWYSAGLGCRRIGQGPVLVLLHGGSGSRTHWTRNIAELSREFTVITPDLPGFGDSASPPSLMGVVDYWKWVADAMQAIVAGERFHLAGFSFGGAVAAAVAAELASRGSPPVRMTLVSPAGFGKPAGREILLEKVPKGLHATEQDIRGATARNLGRWMLAQAPNPSEEAVDIHLQNVANVRYDSRQISHRESLINDLRSAEVPTQVLLGAADPLVFPSMQARHVALRTALPACRLETIPAGGHWLPYEASGVVNSRLIKFHLKGESNDI